MDHEPNSGRLVEIIEGSYFAEESVYVVSDPLGGDESFCKHVVVNTEECCDRVLSLLVCILYRV